MSTEVRARPANGCPHGVRRRRQQRFALVCLLAAGWALATLTGWLP